MNPQSTTRGLCRELVRHHMSTLQYRDASIDEYAAGIQVAIIGAFRIAYDVSFDVAEELMWGIREELEKGE